MNRFVEAGIAAEIADGKQVIYCGLQVEGRDLLEAVHNLIGPDLSGIRRAHGREEVTTLSSGRLTFASSDRTLRGRTADLVFIDYSMDQSTMSQQMHESARFAVLSRGGEIIRA